MTAANKTLASDINRPVAIASMIFLGTVGVLSFIVQPGLVQGFVSELNVSEVDANRLAFMELLGMAASTIAMTFLTRMVAWRILLIIALLLAGAGYLASAASSNIGLLNAARFVAGLGQGATISLIFSVLGLTTKKDRNYALYLVSVLTYGALGIWAMPRLFEFIGLSGIFTTWALICFASFFAVRYIPNSADERTEDCPTAVNIGLHFVVVGLIGFSLYNIAIGISWANLFLIGMTIKPDAQAVANGFLICQFVAIGGALLALALERVLTRNLWIVSGVAGSAVSIALLLMEPGFIQFVVAICLFNFMWNFALPFILSAICDMDESGRIMPVAVACQQIGTSFGPFFGAWILAGGGGFPTIERFTLALFLTSLVLFTIPLWAHKKALGAKVAR